MSSFDKFKIRTAYLLIIFTIGIYIFAKSEMYEIQVDSAEIQNKISDFEKSIDETTVKINTENARDQIETDYPDLEINDNVYYLEQDE